MVHFYGILCSHGTLLYVTPKITLRRVIAYVALVQHFSANSSMHFEHSSGPIPILIRLPMSEIR